MLAPSTKMCVTSIPASSCAWLLLRLRSLFILRCCAGKLTLAQLFYILIGLLCAFGLVSFLSLLRARHRRNAIIREVSASRQYSTKYRAEPLLDALLL